MCIYGNSTLAVSGYTLILQILRSQLAVFLACHGQIKLPHGGGAGVYPSQRIRSILINTFHNIKPL